ncbi:MAG: hypothetical protein RLZZ32_1545 [Cyanobacteriota bacterium]|jgi:acylphosphatase
MEQGRPSQRQSPPGWLIADTRPLGRGTRTAKVRQWIKSERTDPNPPRSERWQLLIRGQVQGVGYRASCCRKAKELGLSGWVRNLSDGSVEVQAEGPAYLLTEMRLWCERGPRGAEVLGVSHGQLPCLQEDWFEVRH